MAGPYMLDTNTVSLIFRLTSSVLSNLSKVSHSSLAVSAITEGELRFGAARRPDATRLHAAIDDFLLRVPILPWDSDAALHYAHLRAALEREGKPLGNLDMLIAAHALSVGATLVTSDRAFGRIKGLEIEDWTKPARH